ncbi:MAG TPA: CPBP family intramembrane glutamic endopeptidase, partial [Candidatus Dormibacteraeota bacterium]|nr:CPBP family intramembrane glutamic endopeptidase [Candidatus Dormibacteraeota bacterium]
MTAIETNIAEEGARAGAEQIPPQRRPGLRFLLGFVLPVALALGWVFVRSRSLYASVGLHALFNGVPVLAYLLVGRP